MPAVYAGHIDRVVWIRPEWAHQLPCGDYHVGVGKRKEGGRIAVDLPLPYYLEELQYAAGAELDNTKCVLPVGDGTRSACAWHRRERKR